LSLAPTFGGFPVVATLLLASATSLPEVITNVTGAARSAT